MSEKLQLLGCGENFVPGIMLTKNPLYNCSPRADGELKTQYNTIIDKCGHRGLNKDIRTKTDTEIISITSTPLAPKSLSCCLRVYNVFHASHTSTLGPKHVES